MAYRRATSLILKAKECVMGQWKPHLQKFPNFIKQEHCYNHCGKAVRTLHTGTTLMVAKLLSVEELFAKKSLQEYLRKMEVEYNECMREINSSVTEQQCSQDELSTKRTKVSLLTPLVQSIRELETKQAELAETEVLLKGKTDLQFGQ